MRLVGAVAFSLGLGLIACGGSSGREAPDGAPGSGGRVGAGGGGAGGVPSAAGGATGHDAGAPDASDAETGAPLPDASDAGQEARVAAETGQGGVTLCAAVTIDAPAAQVTILDNGKAIDEDAFLGGVIGSGTWVLTQVVHFGAAYAGPTRALWIVDGTERTLEAAWLDGETATSVWYALANATPAILTGFPSCGASAPSNWNYLVTDDGATLSVNLRGSSDVLLFSRQGASVDHVVGP